MIEPVFVVGAPRAGARLVYESLSGCREVFTREETYADPLATIPELSPEVRGWDTDRLERAAPDVVAQYNALFGVHLRDREDREPDVAPVVRTLEFGFAHALRVPFLRQVFPRARFVVVERDARAAVSSLMEAWESGRFVTYPSLPGWTGLPWSFPLVEGWRELIGADLLHVASRQWSSISEQLQRDVASLPNDQVTRVEFEAFLMDPASAVRRVADQLGWVFDRPLALPLPLTRSTISAPAPDKWKVLHPALISLPEPVAAESAPSRPTPRRGPTAAASPGAAGAAAGSLFESSYTTSFLQLLAATGRSLLVSGYQSGRLISLREENGTLNTHFVGFDSPMGVACTPTTLVVATRREIHEHQHHDGAARVLAPAGSHDACYLPRNIHVTGDIGVHEVAFTRDGLWAVSTRFSCLASFDAVNSFVPRWKPEFVTRIAAEDRCHLNGVAIRDGQARYVSALGRTDEPGGWRRGKGTSGVLIDVTNGDIIAEGLAMPHSPRYYDGHLWMLESGNGTLARIDPATGAIDTVATLPGFTRGLAFHGRTAFVGLSLVRDTVFRGLPVTSRSDRACGVWAIDIDTGATLGWVRFEGIVQELFDVQVCPWRHPGIAEISDDIVGDSFAVP